MTKAAAIIVAAGAGKRFGGKVRKQFVTLAGKPVFMWSVKEFRKLPQIKQLILVVPPAQISAFKAYPIKFGVDIAAGGKERIDSVRAGLSAVREDIDIVAIHDGARPLITADIIRKSILAAEKYGSAVVSVNARDTVKITLQPVASSQRPGIGKTKGTTTNSFVAKTIPRDTIWLAQTPQTFKKKLIDAAYTKLRTKNITDDAQVAELAGYKVAIVPGNYDNIKITDKKDIEIAKVLLKTQCVKCKV